MRRQGHDDEDGDRYSGTAPKAEEFPGPGSAMIARQGIKYALPHREEVSQLPSDISQINRTLTYSVEQAYRLCVVEAKIALVVITTAILADGPGLRHRYMQE